MIETVLGFIGQILYPLFGIIFYLIDMLQAIFFAFAGINDVLYDGTTIGSGNTGDVNDNGLIFYLLNSSVVRNAMYSIILLAVVLIIIFTVMAFLKNIYADKPKSWKEILSSAIKGIANFFIIPVMCLLGVWLGNILLVAINGATSATNTMNLSRQLFITSSYNANRVRSGDLYGDSISEEEATEIQTFCSRYGVSVDLPSDPNGDTNLEYYAGKIDEVYAMANGPDITFTYTSVSRYYDLVGINYILLAGGGIFILYILVNIAFMMIKRMIMILILFIISPAICAMYPLDDGSKVKSWKESFIKQFLSAFSAVAAMNLFFCISPLIQNIGIPGLDDLMGLLPLLLTIAGLYVVKDLITLINSFIGGETAFDDSLAKSVRGRIDFKKRAQKVAKVVGGAFGAGAASYSNARARGEGRASSFFKGFLGGSAGNLGRQFNDASKNWGLGLRGAASEAYGKGQKAWAESHKSQVEEVEKQKNLAKEENKVTDALNAGQAKMTGHEFDTDVRAATRTFGEEIVNNATETIMDDVTNKARAAASAAAGTSIEAKMKKEQEIIEKYSGVSGAQIQNEMSSIGSAAKLQGAFEETTNKMISMLNDEKDADIQNRMIKGYKYSDDQINDSSLSVADRNHMLDVNKKVDAYAQKMAERKSIGDQYISALENIKNNTHNDAIASSTDDMIKSVKDVIENNSLSSATQSTETIKLWTEIKDIIQRGVNAQVTSADGIKKVAANTANKRVNSDKDSK